jgi:hypothetical protein
MAGVKIYKNTLGIIRIRNIFTICPVYNRNKPIIQNFRIGGAALVILPKKIGINLALWMVVVILIINSVVTE